MKSLTRLFIVFCACNAFALVAFAGPESLPSSDKEMKEVAPVPPPECNWAGFYVGVNAGGQFGHSEDTDIDGYNTGLNDIEGKSWGYGESGFSGGVQAGYNWQWRWLVLGPEVDGGYMDLHGRGVEPISPGGDTHGESDSDLFTTLRGRIGIALNKWLIYATGGGIGVHYTARVIDDAFISPAGPDLEDGRMTNFAWGYTVGGGVERMIGCHWSLKAEYLYFNVDPGSFTGQGSSPGSFTGSAAPNAGGGGDPFTTRWSAETTGHIIRLGLNYRF